MADSTLFYLSLIFVTGKDGSFCCLEEKYIISAYLHKVNKSLHWERKDSGYFFHLLPQGKEVGKWNNLPGALTNLLSLFKFVYIKSQLLSSVWPKFLFSYKCLCGIFFLLHVLRFFFFDKNKSQKLSYILNYFKYSWGQVYAEGKDFQS